MQDIQHLESLGATPEAFKAYFTTSKSKGKKNVKPEDRDNADRLQELHASRLRRGIEANLVEAPIYGAIDQALNASHDNLPFIQARQLALQGKTNEEIMELFKSFKLEKLLEPVYKVVDGVEQQQFVQVGNRKEPMLAFNQPLFDTVVVPLVSSYVNIRVGKLYNDRNTFPRYKYTPPRMTMQDMVVSDIVTSRVQRMTQDMGYAEDDKQSIRQMAAYGICFNFPMESYYKEEYETKSDDKMVTKVQREGVRFVIPHPTRHFWDKSYPLYTFNSDTGVKFAGYWDIKKWSEIKGNTNYWNTDKITYGGYDLFASATWRIYSQYYPCVIDIPPAVKDANTAQANDRIRTEQSTYLKDEKDATITLGVIFDKINPKQWGLFDYDKEVWMRFVYANFDTCIHCEVLPYTPGYVYLDRYDANKTVADPIGLQLVPFAQLLGNFLTQHFQSVKQNLMRIAWVNTDIMPAEQLNWLKRAKDKLYQGIHWLTYSKKHNSFQIGDRGDQREAVTPMQVTQVSTQDLGANINLTIMALERMLGFSPQEVGAAASHEQSATEMTVVAGSTSVNLEFMGTGIDSAWAAKKRLLYTAFYCYGSDEVFAEVADMIPEREAALKKLGFEVEDSEKGATHAGVKGKKAALTLDSFMTDREGINRLSDSKLGIAMLQALGSVASNQPLFEKIGVDEFVKLLNQVWHMVGLPDDFRLKATVDTSAAMQQQQQQVLQMAQQMKDAIVQAAVQVVGEQIKSQVVEPVTQEFLAVKQHMEQLAATDQQIGQALMKVNQEVQMLAQRPPQQVPVPVPQPVPVPVEPATMQPPINNGPIPIDPGTLANAQGGPAGGVL